MFIDIYLKNRINYTYLGTYKKNSFFKQLMYACKRIAIDKATSNPNTFSDSGIILFCGSQGSGKTSSLVHYVDTLKQKFPSAFIQSNFDLYNYDFELLQSGSQIGQCHNGIYGQIVCIDEIGSWYNSKMSKNIPMEFFNSLTQCRKNRRVILATAQQFYMCAKDIRTQTKYVYDCHNIAGAINICIKKQPQVDSEGNVIKMSIRGISFFVQDDNLRNSYDTLQCIDTLSASEFMPRM